MTTICLLFSAFLLFDLLVISVGKKGKISLSVVISLPFIETLQFLLYPLKIRVPTLYSRWNGQLPNSIRAL